MFLKEVSLFLKGQYFRTCLRKRFFCFYLYTNIRYYFHFTISVSWKFPKMFRFVVFVSLCVFASAQKRSPCPDVLKFEENLEEPGKWYGLVTLKSPETLKGVWLRIIFDKPVVTVGVSKIFTNPENSTYSFCAIFSELVWWILHIRQPEIHYQTARLRTRVRSNDQIALLCPIWESSRHSDREDNPLERQNCLQSGRRVHRRRSVQEQGGWTAVQQDRLLIMMMW